MTVVKVLVFSEHPEVKEVYRGRSKLGPFFNRKTLTMSLEFTCLLFGRTVVSFLLFTIETSGLDFTIASYRPLP